MREYCIKYLFLCCLLWLAGSVFAQERFPDGTPIPDWFADSRVTPVKELGGIYRITDYGVQNDSTLLQTEQIQADYIIKKGLSAYRKLLGNNFVFPTCSACEELLNK